MWIIRLKSFICYSQGSSCYTGKLLIMTPIHAKIKTKTFYGINDRENIIDGI